MNEQITPQELRELYEQDKKTRQKAFFDEMQALAQKYNVTVEVEMIAQGNTAIARLVIKAL